MKKLFALVLLAGGCLFTQSGFAQISLAINIGPPPAPRVVRVQPRAPGPGFVWVDGYWYPIGRRYRWHAGYWTRPPYEGAVWIGPHHDGHQFFAGFWQRPGGERIEHDHRWDHDRDRDWRH